LNRDLPARARASGYPAAPLIETIFAASFVDGLSADERDNLAQSARAFYPETQAESHHTIKIENDQVSVGEPETFYRLEGEDRTELLLIRPEGLNTCQLAPYRSWDVLFDRFKRDLLNLWAKYPNKQVNRLAVRSINRIDVPLVNSSAAYEDYLALHIRVPEELPGIGPFNLELTLAVPEVMAIATIRSGVTEPPVEGFASFILDIDLARTAEIPMEHDAVLEAFGAFRQPKNRLYRALLKPKALEEFQ
jgi:uncharacterized protein (TIGR04255 family)